MSTVEKLLGNVVLWAAAHPDVAGVALVGSHARGTARVDSDIDLVILTEYAPSLVNRTEWASAFGEISGSAVEDYGRLKSVRVWYASGLEVEFGIATPDWALEPDTGTLAVARNGLRILFDRGEVFAGFMPW